MIERTPEFDLAEKLIRETNCHLFLTGKAGSGKTTFLKYLIENCEKRMVVVAPTGVAAINAGGVTIHSFFQINFGPYVPGQKSSEAHKMRKEKISIIRTLDLLVIDEISMVRADLLDAVDDVLRRIRRNSFPFGGVQLLMIGDTQQLTPVANDDEWMILNRYYDTPYFFSSTALRRTHYACIELKKIFRQADKHFIELLNDVRDNKATQETIDELNKRYCPNFTPRDEDGYIQLTTHNYSAQKVNSQRMDGLTSEEKNFAAEIQGKFPESSYPNDVQLKLKKGAQVMFVKNDSSSEKRYFNGKIGRVKDFDGDNIIVTDDKYNVDITVSREIWENVKYTINKETNEIETVVDGTFSQYPLKAAWAITIHKSQGLTFERAIIDAKDSFSHGQVYVALSRCKTLEGMVLSSPLSLSSIKHDHRVETFNSEAESLVPNSHQLEYYREEYQMQLLSELFSFHNISNDLGIYHRILIESLYKQYPSLIEKMDLAKASMDKEILDVANRFDMQLRQLLTEKNETLLNERISKGIVYFLGKIADIILPVCQECGKVTCDNKEVLSHLADCFRQLKSDLNMKVVAFEACKEGFNTQRYLRAKNNAELNDNLTVREEESKPKVKKENVTEDVLNPELYEELRKWRKKQADELGAPAYVVLSQMALINVANYLPTTDKELLSLNGIGSRTAERYGKDLLSIVEKCITQYKYDKKVQLDKLSSAAEIVKEKVKAKHIEQKVQKEKKEKTKSRDITLQLFNELGSIEAVAKERNFAKSTIEEHIIECIIDGKLNLEIITIQKRLDKIKTHIINHPDVPSKEIFEALGGEFSYPEIRLARWQMSQEKGSEK